MEDSPVVFKGYKSRIPAGLKLGTHGTLLKLQDVAKKKNQAKLTAYCKT